jgi:Bacterial dipeptidyl-peptidase Sh3 domain/NlpC/P60 family
MNTLDRRISPFRADLAADFLKGRVVAENYATGQVMRVVSAAAPLRRAPQADAPLDTEALAGDSVTVYERTNGWVWGQLGSDGYVGYLPESALSMDAPAPTHHVSALRTYVYPGASIKLPPVDLLSLGAGVTVAHEDGAFAVLTDGRHIWSGHLRPTGTPAADFVAVAQGFAGAPYLWGGKTSIGLDCSGLTQVSLAAAGIKAPRDSDMLERDIGQPIAFANDLSGLRRGDLIFWKGHVGIMTDPKTLLHANGYHMLVVTEPLAGARDRIHAKSFGAITSIKRL